jgi:ABC-type Fe3+/spermidine/putrescine transport system ATPase subunit
VAERGADAWKVDLFGTTQTITASADPKLQGGDSATLLVRPESVRLTVEPVSERGALAGIVRRTSYLGVQAEHDVEVNGSLLTVVRYDPREKDLYPEGKEVYLNFVGENLYLLPA